MSSSRPSNLGYLVDLAVQLQRDADHPEAALHRRDRALARELTSDHRDRRALLTGWLDALRAARPPLPGRQVGIAYRLVVLGLVILGLLIGWGTAAAVFHYDGSRPVNVINVLAVLVAAQLILLLFLGIVLLPHRWLRHLPGAMAVQESLAWLSPGQLARLVLNRLPRDLRDRLQATFQPHTGYAQHFSRVQQWAIVLAAQSFAVAFNVGALAASLYLITFSDLAFSWSTTLEPDVPTAHLLTQLLSTPWASVAPEAVPSPELIRQTLYYRQSGPPAGSSPARWGEWWPFLVACVVTYGLLPRVLLLLLAGWRFHRAVNRALVETPGATVVLDRLCSALVSTQALEADLERAAGSLPEKPGPRPPIEAVGSGIPSFNAGPLCLINWGGLDVADQTLQERVRQSWRRPVAGVFHAGGRLSVEADAKAICDVAAVSGQPAVAVLVKSWEPPVLEVADFLRDLRQALGAGRLVLAVPVGRDAAGQFIAPRDADTGQWQKRVRSLGDAALVVRPWQEGGRA